MKLQIVPFEGLNPFQENTYLVTDGARAHIFDPGFSTEQEFSSLLTALQKRNLSVEAIVLTHAHIDHIMGLERCTGHFKVPVYMHAEGMEFIDQYPEQARMFGFMAEPIRVSPRFVEPSSALSIGSFVYDARYTPGHAPGHLSFYHQEGEWVLSGDALFAGSIGRTDLPGGDYPTLEQSIRQQLYTLPDHTTVWSGHGPTTTIGHEKAHNAFVRD